MFVYFLLDSLLWKMGKLDLYTKNILVFCIFLGVNCGYNTKVTGLKLIDAFEINWSINYKYTDLVMGNVQVLKDVPYFTFIDHEMNCVISINLNDNLKVDSFFYENEGPNSFDQKPMLCYRNEFNEFIVRTSQNIYLVKNKDIDKAINFTLNTEKYMLIDPFCSFGWPSSIDNYFTFFKFDRTNYKIQTICYVEMNNLNLTETTNFIADYPNLISKSSKLVSNSTLPYPVYRTQGILSSWYSNIIRVEDSIKMFNEFNVVDSKINFTDPKYGIDNFKSLLHLGNNINGPVFKLETSPYLYRIQSHELLPNKYIELEVINEKGKIVSKVSIEGTIKFVYKDRIYTGLADEENAKIRILEYKFF